MLLSPRKTNIKCQYNEMSISCTWHPCLTIPTCLMATGVLDPVEGTASHTTWKLNMNCIDICIYVWLYIHISICTNCIPIEGETSFDITLFNSLVGLVGIITIKKYPSQICNTQVNLLIFPQKKSISLYISTLCRIQLSGFFNWKGHIKTDRSQAHKHHQTHWTVDSEDGSFPQMRKRRKS